LVWAIAGLHLTTSPCLPAPSIPRGSAHAHLGQKLVAMALATDEDDDGYGDGDGSPSVLTVLGGG